MPLDIASKPEVSRLPFPRCHNPDSTDLTTGTRSLLNVELRSPSWYLSTFQCTDLESHVSQVAGESGLGKTTFINTLFSTTIKNYADHRRRHAKQVDKTVEIEITKAELEEKFFKGTIPYYLRSCGCFF